MAGGTAKIPLLGLLAGLLIAMLAALPLSGCGAPEGDTSAPPPPAEEKDGAAPPPPPEDAAGGGSYPYEAEEPPAAGAPMPDAPPVSPPPPESQLPEFPWPPPTASASYVLPDALLKPFPTVGAVTNAILGALERGGYVERSFFRTQDGGVALVTRLERINDDGTPADKNRWPAGTQHQDSTQDLLKFLRGLFYVDPGHYRVIVFIIQDLPFTQTPDNITAGEAQAWLTTGANALPAAIAARPFDVDQGSRATALIYEFASDGTKVQVVVSSMTGKQHLEKAGLLTALDSAE